MEKVGCRFGWRYEMGEERCLELLNNLIEFLRSQYDESEVIYQLLDNGFTAEELTSEFNFDLDDIDEVKMNNPYMF